MQKVKIVVLVSVSLIVCLILTVYTSASKLFGDDLTKRVKSSLIDGLENSLNRKVTIQDIETSLSGMVHIKGLEISAKGIGVENSPFVTVKDIRIQMSVLELIRNSSEPINSVKKISMSGVYVSLEADDRGKWNINDLLEANDHSHKYGQDMTIDLNDTQVSIKTSKGTKYWGLPIDEVIKLSKGTLKLVSTGYDFTGDMRVKSLGEASFSTEVGYLDKSNEMIASITGKKLDLPVVMARLPQQYAIFSNASGYADFESKITLAKGEPTVVASIYLDSVSGRYRGFTEYGFSKVKGKLSYDNKGITLDDIALKVAEGNITVNGSVSGYQIPDMDLDVTYSDINAKSVQRLMDFQSGKIDGSLSGHMNVKGKLDSPVLSGSVVIVDGVITTPIMSESISKINGLINVVKNRATLRDVKFELDNSKGLISGDVINIFKPQLALELSSDNFDTSILSKCINGLRAMNLKGSGVNHLLINGRPNDLRLIGDARIGNANAYGVPISDVKVKYEWEDNEFLVNSLTGSSLNGVINGNGKTAFLGPGKVVNQYDFFITEDEAMDSKDLCETLFDKKMDGLNQITGKLSGRFKYASSPSRRGTISGQAQLNHGSIMGILYKKILSEIAIENGKMIFNSLSAVGDKFDEGSSVNATGSVDLMDPYRYTFEIDASGLQMAKLMDNKVDGRADFKGILIGSSSGWGLSGAMNGRGIDVLGVQVDHVDGNVDIKPDLINTDRLRFVNGSSVYMLTGEFRYRDNDVDGQLDVKDGNISDLTKIARSMGVKELNNPTIKSLLNNSGRITGTMDLKFKDAIDSINGDIISSQFILGKDIVSASGSFSSVGDNIELKNVKLMGDVLNGSLAGSVKKDGSDANLGLSIHGIQLKILDSIFEKKLGLNGRANIDGVLKGKFMNPEFYGNINVTDAIWKDISIPIISGEVRWLDKSLEILSADGNPNNGKMHASGTMDFSEKAPSVEINGVVEKVDLRNVIDSIPITQEISGKMSGSIMVNGTFYQPEVICDLNLDDVVVNGIDIGGGPVALSYFNKSIDITKCQVGTGNMKLIGKGSINQAGETSLSLKVTRFQLGSIFKNKKSPINLVADADIQISDTISNPRVAVSFQKATGLLKGISIQEASGTMILDDGNINIQNIDVSSNRGNLSLAGLIPLYNGSSMISAIRDMIEKFKKGESPDIPGLNISITLKRGALSMLPLITPMVESSSGGDEIDFSVSGSLRHPLLKGNGRITNGKIKVRYLNGSFDKVTGDFYFHENKIVVNGISATGPAGSVNGLGSVAYNAGSGFTIDSKLRFNGISVKEPIKCEVSGNLSISQVPGRPMYMQSADLVFSEGSISIPTSLLANASKQVEGSKFDPNLSLTAWVGNNIRFKQQGLADVEIQPGENITVTGNISKPKIEGTISSHRGSFEYLGTSFKMSEGVLELKSNSPESKKKDEVSIGNRTNIVGNTMFQGEVKGETTIKNVKVYLTLTASSMGITSDLKSTPPMSDRDIRALLSWPSRLESLTGSDIEEGITDEVQALLVDQVRQYFVGGVEDVFKNALGLDEFKLEPASQEGYQVSFGKYVNDKLFVTYTNSLNSDPLRNLKIDYTIKPGLYLSAQIDNKKDFKLFMDTKIKF